MKEYKFLNENLPVFVKDLIVDLLQSDQIFFWLILLLTFLVIVLEALSKIAKHYQKKSGIINPQIKSIFNPESNFLESREYISEVQMLSGKPDTLLMENNFIIPIEKKIYTKKIRDRLIAQVMVYMKLIEEFEGKKPPYAYLILGKRNRKVKVLNTITRQIWLKGLTEELYVISSGKKEAKAAPLLNKCKKCPVLKHCKEGTGLMISLKKPLSAN